MKQAFSLVVLLALLATVPAAAETAFLTMEPDPASGPLPAETRFTVRLGSDEGSRLVRELYVSLTRGGAAVPIEARRLSGKRAVTIRPVAPLEPGGEYTLAAKCRVGRSRVESAAATYVVERRRPAGPTRLSAVSPCRDGNSCGGRMPGAPQDPASAVMEEFPEIAAEFDGRLLPPRDNDWCESLGLFDGAERLPATVRYEDGPRRSRLVLTPLVALKSGRTYRAQLSGKLRGLDGDPVGTCREPSPPAPEPCIGASGPALRKEWSFQAGDLFRLTGSYPDAAHARIRSTDRILLRFSAPLDPAVDLRDFVKIVDATDSALPGAFTAQGTNAVVFSPDLAFPPGAHAVLLSSDLPSRGGNRLAGDVVIRFEVARDAFNEWGKDE